MIRLNGKLWYLIFVAFIFTREKYDEVRGESVEKENRE